MMAVRRITSTALAEIPLIAPGDDLAAIIIAALKRDNLSLQTGDVIVLAQKIVSKAEGRYVDLNTVTPSARAQEIAAEVNKDPRHVEVILSESTEVLRQRTGVLIVVHRLGFIMANAGVDQSNIDHVEGTEPVLLLPVDPDASCIRLKTRLDQTFNCSVGVVINDSFGRPWRNGVTGVALGAAGIPSLHSLVGSPDLFGRALRVSEVAVADELAATASLLMGQANEGCPVVHIRGFVTQAPDCNAQALIRPKHMDLFR
jgi:coenzyme F420-0:L-glutamate ligase/coenzyme F420-1:gamma-L-glutamate ligase